MPGLSPRDWRAPAAIVAVVVLGYGIAPMRLPLIGEEACRAQFGIEMVESGDWISATNQGVPLLDRPPLHYWVMGIVHGWIHALDPLTLRRFMLLVTLATALAAWAYARSLLGETAALVAGLAYPTMGHVFDLGRRNETDGLFTLLLALALWTWHHGYAREQRPLRTWAGSCVFASLATLCKGTQGPVVFFGTVYLFLLVRRDLRYLRGAAHLAGLALFLLPIAAWQIPFYRVAGWEGTRSTWLEPFTSRIATDTGLLVHLARFPFEVLIAALPWAVLLGGVAYRGFWTLEGRARSALQFQLLGMAAIFLPAWLSHGGKPRYVMPMYPLLAVVCGAVVERAVASGAAAGLRRLVARYYLAFAVLLVGAAAVYVTASVAATTTNAYRVRLLAQPAWLLCVLVACAVAGGLVLARGAADAPDRTARIQATTLAALLALFFNGPGLNVLGRQKIDVGPDVRAVRREVEEHGGRLVSLGKLPLSFVYFYEGPVPIVPSPGAAPADRRDLGYFAVLTTEGQAVDLPFPWTGVARINMDPGRTPSPVVVVGRAGT